MKHLFSVYVPAVGFVLAALAVVIWDAPISALTDMIDGMNMVSYSMYVLLLTTAIVLMPVTVMPLIPLASSVMGPFATALLSIVGWTLGAVIAFLLARYLGRPILSRFISLKKIDEIAERFPQNTRFLIIVLLRLTLPVDIVSYALGLSTRIGLFEYTLATIVGVTWFSFAFAYLGEALLTGNMPLLIELGGASVLIFIGGWYLLKRSK